MSGLEVVVVLLSELLVETGALVDVGVGVEVSITGETTAIGLEVYEINAKTPPAMSNNRIAGIQINFLLNLEIENQMLAMQAV